MKEQILATAHEKSVSVNNKHMFCLFSIKGELTNIPKQRTSKHILLNYVILLVQFKVDTLKSKQCRHAFLLFRTVVTKVSFSESAENAYLCREQEMQI